MSFSTASSASPPSSTITLSPKTYPTMTISNAPYHLPSSNCPSVSLQIATPAQRIRHSEASAPAWKGPLPSAEAFVRREAVLRSTELTRDGGLTGWVLVGPCRRVLMGCETIRKRGLLARPPRLREGGGPVVEDVVVHAVGAVYCPVEHRGRGYSRRLMEELGRRLERWQAAAGETVASVLHSDIGSEFYARHGWKAYPCTHVSLPVAANARTHPILSDAAGDHWPEGVFPVLASDIPALAARDEALLREKLRETGMEGRNAFALVPDAETFDWFHARERFVCGEIHGGKPAPRVRGAVVRRVADGRAVAWCLWTCMWHESDPRVSGKNTLYVLRMVVDESVFDGEEEGIAGGEKAADRAVEGLLGAAGDHALRWGMGSVEIWSPDERIRWAAEAVAGRKVVVAERTEEKVPCLRVFGEQEEGNETRGAVEWIANEKYGWC